MLIEFRKRYPQGSLIGELVKIDRGIYIVRVSIQVNNIILATALASADRVEVAEDAARERAIAALNLDSSPQVDNSNSTSKVSRRDAVPTDSSTQFNQPATSFSESGDRSHIVNFSEPQSEIPEPTIASEPQTVSPIPQSSVTQPNIEPPQEQSGATSSNLFAKTFTGEALASSINDSESQNDLQKDSSLEANIAPETAEVEAIDFNEIIQKTNTEIKRLGWTKDEGRDFLNSRYGKRSRLKLSDEQLLEFLHYLEKLPTPV